MGLADHKPRDGNHSARSPDIFRRYCDKDHCHNDQYGHLDPYVVHQTAAFLSLRSHVMTSVGRASKATRPRPELNRCLGAILVRPWPL